MEFPSYRGKGQAGSDSCQTVAGGERCLVTFMYSGCNVLAPSLVLFPLRNGAEFLIEMLKGPNGERGSLEKGVRAFGDPNAYPDQKGSVGRSRIMMAIVHMCWAW
jgi:hypothetical protein